MKKFIHQAFYIDPSKHLYNGRSMLDHLNYMFNTRFPSNDLCEAPQVFYFETVEKLIMGNQIVTSYVRKSPHRLVACSSSGNHSADFISKIQVLSPVIRQDEVSTF